MSAVGVCAWGSSMYGCGEYMDVKENENMGEKQSLMTRAGYYVTKHMELCGSWDKGDIKGVWQETDGTVYISYENGQWFHYKEEDGRVIICGEENPEEDKRLICESLLNTLKKTSALYNLTDLKYDPYSGVIAKFASGNSHLIHTEADSGIAMVRRIVMSL